MVSCDGTGAVLFNHAKKFSGRVEPAGFPARVPSSPTTRSCSRRTAAPAASRPAATQRAAARQPAAATRRLVAASLPAVVRASGNEPRTDPTTPAILAEPVWSPGISAANAAAAENNCEPTPKTSTCIPTRIRSMMIPSMMISLLRSFASWVVVSIRQSHSTERNRFSPFNQHKLPNLTIFLTGQAWAGIGSPLRD